MTATITTSGLRNPLATSGATSLSSLQWTIAVGTSDAIQGSYAIPNTTLVDGMILGFRAKSANATTIPTFSPDGLAAAVITKEGGKALEVGSIPGSTYEALVRYNVQFNRWELLNPAAVASSTAQGVSTFNLVDLMNTHYGIGGWTQRTGVGQGTDIGPALTDGFNKCRATSTGRGKVFINNGQWLMSSTVPSTLMSGNYIYGDGTQNSVVYFNVNGGSMWNHNGEGGYSGGGVGQMTCILESGLGDTLSYCLFSKADSQFACDAIAYDDIYITSHDSATTWYEGMHIDGSLRTALQGCRIGHVRDVQIFECRNLGAYFNSIVQWDITNLGIYVPKVGSTGGDMYITGTATPTQQTIYATVTRLNIPGTLNLSNCSEVMLDGKVNTLVTSGADYVWGWLNVVSGTVTGSLGAHSNLTIR